MVCRSLQKFSGGSLFVVIPPVMAEQLKLKKGDPISINLEALDKIAIKKLTMLVGMTWLTFAVGTLNFYFNYAF